MQKSCSGKELQTNRTNNYSKDWCNTSSKVVCFHILNDDDYNISFFSKSWMNLWLKTFVIIFSYQLICLICEYIFSSIIMCISCILCIICHNVKFVSCMKSGWNIMIINVHLHVTSTKMWRTIKQFKNVNALIHIFNPKCLDLKRHKV